MRWMTERRLSRWCLMLAVGMMAGCKDKSNPSKSATGSGGSQSSVTTVTTVTPEGPSLRARADEFIKALAEGKAKPDDLTPALKKSISRPISEEDKKIGYSNSDVQNWLAKFEKLIVEDVKESVTGNTIILRGRAKTPGKIDAFCLRLVKDANSTKVDWLHRSDRFLAGDAPKTNDADLSVATEIARNFLETMLGGDLRQAQALMLPTWLTAIEPPSETDKKNGFTYNVGFVNQKMRAWRGETVGYAMTKSELTGNKNTATITAELEAGGRKTVYLVKLIQDKSNGQWLVEDFVKA